MSYREGQFHIKQITQPPTRWAPTTPGWVLVTIPWAGPPSLTEFHSIDNQASMKASHWWYLTRVRRKQKITELTNRIIQKIFNILVSSETDQSALAKKLAKHYQYLFHKIIQTAHCRFDVELYDSSPWCCFPSCTPVCVQFYDTVSCSILLSDVVYFTSKVPIIGKFTYR